MPILVRMILIPAILILLMPVIIPIMLVILLLIVVVKIIGNIIFAKAFWLYFIFKLLLIVWGIV